MEETETRSRRRRDGATMLADVRMPLLKAMVKLEEEGHAVLSSAAEQARALIANALAEHERASSPTIDVEVAIV